MCRNGFSVVQSPKFCRKNATRSLATTVYMSAYIQFAAHPFSYYLMSVFVHQCVKPSLFMLIKVKGLTSFLACRKILTSKNEDCASRDLKKLFYYYFTVNPIIPNGINSEFTMSLNNGEKLQWVLKVGYCPVSNLQQLHHS